MLVRDVGGAAALNSWAASLGATGSAFYDGNTTTAADLSALWVAEAEGRLGGATAQAWLYPLLTRTIYESAIPAGTAGATVIHKTGALDLTENDTALILGLPSGPYVVTVLTDGLDENGGTALIASVAAAVAGFERAR
jgi:beta-lactamase class A